LRPEFSIQRLSNESEGSLCSSIDNVPIISETNVTNPKTNVVLVLKDFSNILKKFETKKVSILNMKRYQMSKLKEQKLVWVDQVAKLLDFVVMFEKSKSKIFQLEFEVTMLQEMFKKMQKGGGCRNSSFGLTTKAKGLQGCGPRGSPGVTSHTPGNVKKCEGVNPHTPKATPTLGDGVLVDFRNFKERFEGSKLNGLWHYLYH
jgi:hypothetical protein